MTGLWSCVVLLALGGDWPKAQAMDGTNPTQVLTVELQEHGYRVAWGDEEERLSGVISARPLREGEAFTFSVKVNARAGDEFNGPVTLSLRSARSLETGGAQQSVTVKPNASHVWAAVFTPNEGGPHVLEVAFRSTHLKQARAELPVERAPMPKWVAAGIAFFVLTVIVSIAGRRVFERSRRATEPEQP